MKLKYDVRFDMPFGVPSLTFFFPQCNMNCTFCDVEKVLSSAPRSTDIENVSNVIEYHRMFVDAVTISGGEPLMFKEDTKTIARMADGMKRYLYTNGLGIDSEILDLFDLIFIDVKGGDPKEISKRANIDLETAEKLYDTYLNLVPNSKIVFRVPDVINLPVWLAGRKNVIVYQVI